MITECSKAQTRKTVKDLKEQGEDYEFYPTTKLIISKLWKDIVSYTKDVHNKGYNRSNLNYSNSYGQDEKDVVEMDSFLDIGTGDGRIMLNPPELDVDIKIKTPMGIEKSSHHADKLIKDGVWMLGRDYMKMTLIDKKFDIVFSNPPYSIFKTWCEKILSEVDAQIIYLLIPQRWKDDEQFKARINEKGDVKVIGSYNFEQGDREARAKVNLIRIVKNKSTKSAFSEWVTENIGSFKRKEEEDLEVEHEKFVNTHVTERKDVRTTLLENYGKGMQNLLNTYKALNEIDFSLLEQLEISRESIINSIASDIKTLKYKFWEQAFSHIDSFKTRLTHKTSEGILKDLKEFKELDFNEDNIRNVIIWVIENFNDLSEKQLLKCYDDMTYFGSVRAYKSNDKWLDDTWRYDKPFPSKHLLDYRIVTNGSSFSKDNFEKSCDIDFHWGWKHKNDNLVYDLSVIACSLGYQNDGLTYLIKFGKQYEILDKDGKVLFTFRMYKNKNLHLKIRKDLLRDINITVGKLKGWIKSPKDIQEEFELSEDEALKYFENDQMVLMKPQTSFQNLLTC